MAAYINHPSEEALERFLLHQSQEPELETIETHILACESCVEILENLEHQIAVTKAALAGLQNEQRAEEGARENRSFFKSWFTLPNLSWAAGAMVAATLCIAAFTPAQITLTANRGVESSMAPEWRPLDAHLSANLLNDGPVAVELVNSEGKSLWSGTSSIQHETLETHLPRLTQKGTYFVRVYEVRASQADSSSATRGDLLREYMFQVK